MRLLVSVCARVYVCMCVCARARAREQHGKGEVIPAGRHALTHTHMHTHTHTRETLFNVKPYEGAHVPLQRGEDAQERVPNDHIRGEVGLFFHPDGQRMQVPRGRTSVNASASDVQRDS